MFFNSAQETEDCEIAEQVEKEKEETNEMVYILNQDVSLGAVQQWDVDVESFLGRLFPADPAQFQYHHARMPSEGHKSTATESIWRW